MKQNLSRIVAALAAVVIVCLAVGTTAQVGPAPESSSCGAAEAWHLRMALRWSERGDQGYHQGAAQAAEVLGAVNDGSCSGWQDDATGPVWRDNQTLGGRAAYEDKGVN